MAPKFEPSRCSGSPWSGDLQSSAVRLFNRGSSASLPRSTRSAAPASPGKELRQLAKSNRRHATLEAQRQLIRLRHLEGVRLIAATERQSLPEPDMGGLPDVEGLPEVAPPQLTAAVVRAGILRDGCLLVRGLLTHHDAATLVTGIDRAFAAREDSEAGRTPEPGYYEEFAPEDPFDVASYRPFIKKGGGVLMVDSPVLAAQMLDVLDRAGIPRLVEAYFGEPPLLSAHKTTLRKAEATHTGSWHQDGSFMGNARALNLWVALSHCGDVAPGLDIVPRRLESIVVKHEEMLRVRLARSKAHEAAGDRGIVRPIFEPGDALFFDELLLHQTAVDPSMPNPRYAIENWFFGGSAFPDGYAPVAV